MMGELGRYRIIVRSLVLADTDMEMGHAERHRQIPIEHLDLFGCLRRSQLPSGTLDERPKSDLAPMILEKIAQEFFETGAVGRQCEDLDGRAIFIDETLWTDSDAHSLQPSMLTNPNRLY